VTSHGSVTCQPRTDFHQICNKHSTSRPNQSCTLTYTAISTGITILQLVFPMYSDQY